MRVQALRQKYREWRTYFASRGRWFSRTFEGGTTGEFLPDASRRWRKRLAHYLYNACFAVVLGFLLAKAGPRTSPVPLLKTGNVSEHDIVSPLTADIEFREGPKANRDELAKKVAPVFDYDDAALENWLHRWEDAFRKTRSEFYSAKKSPKGQAALETVARRLQELTGQTMPLSDLTYLHQRRFALAIESTFVKVGEYLLGRLIAPADLFPSYYSTGIIVRQINQELNETLVYDVSRIWSLEQAREFLTHVPSLFKDQKESTQRVVEIINHLVIPNLKFNPTLTQKRVERLLGLSKTPVVSIKRGQLIVRRGERVNDQQAELLEAINGLMSPAAAFQRFVLTSLVFFVFLSVLFRMNITRRGFWNLNLKDSFFFLFVSIFTVLCVKYSLPYLRLFFGPFNLRYGVEYLLPISSGGIIIHLMMGREAAFTYALMMSMILGFMLDRNYYFSLWAFSVTATAIHTIKACKQRTDLYKCGAWSGTVGAVLIFSFSLSQVSGIDRLDAVSTAIGVTLAFLSGLLAAVITGSFIPILESLFGYTTSLKLLELSNFNHPLLHTLMMKAPGTYHHSVIVGSLAEIAADRVKANALLARVSAYYHDIGKMAKPLYFIENQAPNSNPHDHLSPTMSAKILFSHVKSGVRMAREYNLGSKITNIIEQHHGTTLVSYFLNKAKKVEKPDLDPVNEEDFRYPGPRPQSREAAIVMLADACEAATRSIAEPTPAKIQTMVHSIINRRFLEQQFNECDLTFNDLQVIEECFTRTLTSLYHHRIEYPGQKAAQAAVPPPTLKKVPGGRYSE